MYWAWKNLKDVDIIGLCHYRRYFDFHGQVPFYKHEQRFATEQFGSLNISIPNNILKSVIEGNVVVSNPIHFGSSLALDYCKCHISDDFSTLDNIINSTQSDYIKDAFFRVMRQSNKLMPCNMFLMNWTDFDRYCTWIFDILSRVEKAADISYYNPVQKRIYGYMAERLFNVWLVAEKKKIIQKPVLLINDIQPNHPERNLIKSLLWNMRSDLAMWLVASRKKLN